jgi:uncharacterized membrane protein SpoIIM required for sporulation
MLKRDKRLRTLAGFAVGIFPALFIFLSGTVVAALAGLYKDYDNSPGSTDVDEWTAILVGGVLADTVALVGVGIVSLIA